ncbi:PREDICTED: membrane-spanning 4-domains subfamily A member 4A [Chinchilla lanigera]|uniref:membrane-spanning 4-domains subfamily A member 4A n=1 Tax=Chinchilla lanigera TaxID=34839 RepID=UPI00038EB665|nr:PREDICTED: membrane-spanning 4-domains subfamily A member 4A [Chinchilla lanigera]XP_005408145.1 PREDICTED: membrane-spanning 4-domains subfamily A member 4A [Chinchilla lanigera]XP_005408146.1 PREDICTED: membrane-spanning 4-domains subfamily A member 4A [Chinchilla lanigera]XP_013361961.1 PREDICTED: membrane-spanning 4-domains subfamily A member 4A [Chinchilla lanigera]
MALQGRSSAVPQGHPGLMTFPQDEQSHIQSFTEGEPVILGVTQIMIRLMYICLCMMLKITHSDIYFPLETEAVVFYLQLLGPICYILSGTPSTVSGRKMTKNVQGISVVKVVLTVLEFCIALNLSAFGCHVVCCGGTSVVTDLSSSELGVSARAPYADYDEVAFVPT